MKYKFILIISSFFMAYLGFSQESDSIAGDTIVPKTFDEYVHNQAHKNNTINFEYNYCLASVINNDMLQKFIYGGFIDQQIIDDNMNRLSDESNLLGTTMDFKIEYQRFTSNFLGFDNVGYSVGFEWHNLQDLEFTKDGFSLLFNGNKAFAGENANLNNTTNTSLQYSQLKFGIFKESNHSEYGFRLALNIGNQYSSFKTKNAYLFTEADGKSLELNMEFDYQQSENIDNNLAKVQGLGTSVDLFYKIGEYQRYIFSVEIDNIGFLYWNNKSISYKGTENQVFEGVVVDNIFKMPDPFYSATLEDSLSNYIEDNGEKTSFFSPTPMDLKISYQHYFNNNISASAIFHHRFFTSYMPYYQIGAEYHIQEKYHIGANINYGGYAKLNFGVSLSTEISDNLIFEVQTRYLSGLYGYMFSGIGSFAKINYKF